MLAAQAVVLALVLVFLPEHVDSYFQSFSTYHHRQSLQQRSSTYYHRQSLQQRSSTYYHRQSLQQRSSTYYHRQSLQQRCYHRQTSPQMLPRIMQQGKADCQYINSPANHPSMSSFESSIFSRCASVGFHRREKLPVDEETRSKLVESGILTKEFAERLNQVVFAACEV
ncbi:hypothetical protein GUITHDRAFT_154174 [Guillardia theta CCMP2712]|uniref:Uncharacterized protein n=1 Tax=Guillardia theta (strain CCMP2712) TaxID=905079 RepID=L1IVL0_GUITC|nr:hypothetical protein GUITHDRAFT_154174 [Guillardia theta CCMP2712]EKX40152.1 hypothetical protein GUITHDRAFT_154174 [Guillardia theta CCMP2712]|eukprot:XP_005827132.1 hypothetical protein GUITHDRAFT_154174 [Guillardia theta CCMP2712]